jgi:predicted nucleic acid binding AN1-type Zn finger protein
VNDTGEKWSDKYKIVETVYICSMCGGSGKIPGKHPMATGDACLDHVYCPGCDSLGTTMTANLVEKGLSSQAVASE